MLQITQHTTRSYVCIQALFYCPQKHSDLNCELEKLFRKYINVQRQQFHKETLLF